MGKITEDRYLEIKKETDASDEACALMILAEKIEYCGDRIRDLGLGPGGPGGYPGAIELLTIKLYERIGHLKDAVDRIGQDDY